jgi:hypothetical protein
VCQAPFWSCRRKSGAGWPGAGLASAADVINDNMAPAYFFIKLLIVAAPVLLFFLKYSF